MTFSAWRTVLVLCLGALVGVVAGCGRKASLDAPPGETPAYPRPFPRPF